jgi:hypothetical protein
MCRKVSGFADPNHLFQEGGMKTGAEKDSGFGKGRINSLKPRVLA